jgi:MFS family permease
MLIAGRFLAGVGGAFASAVVLGMIVTMFPEPREQAKAIGVYGFVASAGGSIGLLAGGSLTQAISWHWIFLINLPIGIAVALGARRLVPGRPGIGLGAGADTLGAALITGSLMIGTYAILGVGEHGWTSAQTLGLSAASAALFAVFLTRQARIANPLVPLGLFRNRNLSGANAIQAFLVAGMFGMFFLGALYLQRILGYDALEVGLAFLPATLAMGTLSLGFSEKLIMRFGPRRTLLPGVAMIGAGLLLFARTPVDGTYLTDLMPPMLLVGVGVGTSFPSLMTLAMSDAAPSEAGLASGVVNTSMQVGGAIGLAVLATLAEQRSDDLTAPGAKVTDAALNSGYHLAYLIGAVLVATALAIAFVVLREPEPAAEAAERSERGAQEPEPAYSDAV